MSVGDCRDIQRGGIDGDGSGLYAARRGPVAPAALRRCDVPSRHREPCLRASDTRSRRIDPGRGRPSPDGWRPRPGWISTRGVLWGRGQHLRACSAAGVSDRRSTASFERSQCTVVRCYCRRCAPLGISAAVPVALFAADL